MKKLLVTTFCLAVIYCQNGSAWDIDAELITPEWVNGFCFAVTNVIPENSDCELIKALNEALEN